MRADAGLARQTGGRWRQQLAGIPADAAAGEAAAKAHGALDNGCGSRKIAVCNSRVWQPAGAVGQPSQRAAASNGTGMAAVPAVTSQPLAW